MPKGTDIKAGEAFLRLAEHDPGAQRFLAQLQAARPKLIALGRILAEEFGGQSDEESEESLAWRELFGEPFPETIDDWQRWAARLGLSADWIIKGDWTPVDLLPIIEGELLRRKDRAAEQAAESTTDGPALAPEERAILFVRQHLKSTGNLPSKTAVARLLGVNRRTLGNWKAFKVAYARMKAEQRRPPPRGAKDRDGNLEAWRD